MAAAQHPRKQDRVRQQGEIAELRWPTLCESAEGSTWASIVALFAVTGMLGALYLPLLIH